MEAALKLWNFGDSGAFADIHFPQYPQGMGDPARETASAANKAKLQQQQQQQRHQQQQPSSSALMIVQTGQSSLATTTFTAEELAKPDEQQVQQLADQTARDLDIARRRAAASASGTVTAGRAIAGGGNRTEVVQDSASGRTFAVTEIGRDIAEMRHMHLAKIKPGAVSAAATANSGSSSSSSGGRKGAGGAGGDPSLVLYDPDGSAALIRTETRKLTAAEKAEFAVPRAVFSGRNPKSLLIDTKERELHDGFNYIDHTDVSAKHAEAARAMADASARAEADQRQRQRDAEREREKQQEDDRQRLMREAQAALTRTAAAAAAGGAGGSNNSDSGSGGAVDSYKDRSREMQERRKLHALQRTAETLGVDVQDLMAQDEDVQIELVDTTTRHPSSKLGGAFDSRIGHALQTGDADEGFFGGGRRRDDSNFGGNRNERTGIVNSTMSDLLSNISRDKLELEQQMQLAAGRVAGRTVDGKTAAEAALQQEEQQDDDDDDVFGVNNMLNP